MLFRSWRAVDDEGEVLDLLVQTRRDKAAAVKLLRKLIKKQGFAPEVLAVPGGFCWQGKTYDGFVTLTVAGPSFVGKMADGDLIRSPPIPA